MVFFVRSLGRKALPATPAAESLHRTGSVWIRLLQSFALESEEPVIDLTRILKQRSVGVFWDLDNKPPKNVSPFKAATRLMEMAGGFGNVVDAVAYANQHAFSHVPTWVHEERKKRKMLDELEVRGLVKPEELYVCGVCGAKKKTRVELTKHFKSLHEREQKKRVNRLESLKGKKKQKERFWDNNAEKMSKYKEAARSVILPKVGYGLMQDLRRAGVYVRTVEDKPQAADIALKEHMAVSMKKGVRCICLVSDDSDFTPVLQMARERNLHTVVVGDLRVLNAYADTYFSWAEVASGIAAQKAKLETRLLKADFMNRVGEKLESHRHKGFGFDDDEEDSGGDSDAEFEDGKGWRPPDRTVRFDGENQDFEFFTDDSSESDSDAEPDALHSQPRKLRSYVGYPFGSDVLSRSRCFSTKVISEGPYSEMVSETDVRASLPKGSRGAPNKTQSVSESQSTEDIRVMRLRTADSIGSANHGTEGRASTTPASAGAVTESVQRIFQSVSDSSAALEKRNGLDTERNQPTGVLDIEPDAGKHSGCETSCDRPATGRGRKKKMLSFFQKHPDKQTRTKPEKPENHFGGRSSEPVPFYMSGFASESQRDCERINSWYSDFWTDEEEYKGGRNTEHKRKKK